jgi:ferric-dicitrate binding protein FerR (iron transport regulator)
MNVTKDIICDLFPLYASNECSPDTRALVEEYLRQHPREAESLRRVQDTPLPAPKPSVAALDETRSLREARRQIRRRSWLLAFAIFFSLAPFSFVVTHDRTWWLLREAPGSALVYAALAAVCWTVYAVARRRSRSL